MIEKARGVSTAPDGGIFLAGSTAEDIFGDAPNNLIVAALNSDGSLLRSFAQGGKLRTAFDSEDEYFGIGALYHQGKLLVTGGHRPFPPTTSDMFVVRFLLD